MALHARTLVAKTFLWLAAVGFIGCSTAAADLRDIAAPRTDADLAAVLQPMIDEFDGQAGVAVKHLGTGAGFVHRGDEPMPTASLIKLAVMVTAYERFADGRLSRDSAVTLRDKDKVPGSGILTSHFSAGTQLPLRDAVRLMIAYSDNTATNLVVDAIGLESTAERMEELGLPHTKLHSKVYRRDTSIFPERSERFGLGSTTAAETITLLESIDRGRIAGREICDEMLEHLYACEDRERLVRSLPAGVRAAHKSGYVSQIRADAGLIDGPDGRIAICVLTVADDNAEPDAGSLLIGNLAAAAYQHFYPPSEPEASATDPEDLAGPPAVTCKAWAIGDAATGRVLFGHRADEKLDNASTTKLMTARLVAELARRTPEVLDEEIEFSKRAAGTIGSSSKIEAGERVRVGDLLYGLLLPSGNDAAVALAEHFGSRLAGNDSSNDGEGDEGDEEDAEKIAEKSYQQFIEAMNREAQALGLARTAYKNPHGLTAGGHGSSAGDLVQLAKLILADPLTAKIVSTRSYRCDVKKPDGSSRSVRWANTNQLLQIEGYEGVKTGTTTAAGACLAACGSRDGRRLIVVVLGSAASPSRYADTRNLFRWAWQQPSQ